MLFDPSTADSCLAGGTGGAWQPPRTAAARCGPSTDFLTLPTVADDVSYAARLKWREDVSLTGLVLKQFRYGPLKAGDVQSPSDAADAFQQAFFAWAARQCGKLSRLHFSPVLFDTYALRDVLRHCGTDSNEDDPASLFFGIELDNEWVYQFGPAADVLRAAHPLLLRTVMQVMNHASGRTLFLRSPDWFMYESACWYWDGDDHITDEEAEEMLKDRFGKDDETRRQYLPSVVRSEVCPDDLAGSSYDNGRWVVKPTLDRAAILRLRNRSRGMPRRVCTELLTLMDLMRSSRTRALFHVQCETNPVYAACSVVMPRNQPIVDLPHPHFNSQTPPGHPP